MENSALISKAVKYIQNENKNSKITIDDVAAHAGFSANYFNSIFLSHTGFTVMEYVRFRRMKNASWLLRTTDKDVLDIALECGYETHESFSRAFKKHYGTSPSEYRKLTEKKEVIYGDYHNETLAQRLIHEFNNYRAADTDEVIDFMLEKNAKKYGYAAICLKITGSVVLYKGDDFKDGFVIFYEFDDKIYGEIVCENYALTGSYMKDFSDSRFSLFIYTTDDDGTLRSELGKTGIAVQEILRFEERYYSGTQISITAPEGYSVRMLTYDDTDMIQLFCKENGCFEGYRDFLKQELYQRDVLKSEEYSVFIFGVFRENELIGLSMGSLQRAHEFVINNCVSTSLLEKYRDEALYRYVFAYVTNAAVSHGVLPFDDIQTPYICNEKMPVVVYDDRRSGKFDSKEFGYETAVFCCNINTTRKAEKRQ